MCSNQRTKNKPSDFYFNTLVAHYFLQKPIVSALGFLTFDFYSYRFFRGFDAHGGRTVVTVSEDRVQSMVPMLVQTSLLHLKPKIANDVSYKT